MTLIVDTDCELAGHVAVALRLYRQRRTRDHLPPIPGLGALERVFTTRANQGQPGTPMEDLWEVSQAQIMSPQLLTYEAAAGVLSVSVRQVKRLLADPDCPLSAVQIGGAARIRTHDLNAYVADLRVREKGAA